MRLSAVEISDRLARILGDSMNHVIALGQISLNTPRPGEQIVKRFVPTLHKRGVFTEVFRQNAAAPVRISQRSTGQAQKPKTQKETFRLF